MKYSIIKPKNDKLTIEDLNKSADLAIKRNGFLNTKQIKLLAENGNKDIGIDSFWNWFIQTHGVPQEGERGFLAGTDRFAYYYFEDYGQNNKK
jgi:hypothetical protein